MIDRLVGYSCIFLGGAIVGWSVRDSMTPPPRIEMRRIVAPVTPANIIGCPVTKASIEEHFRHCRARKRNTIQPKGD